MVGPINYNTESITVPLVFHAVVKKGLPLNYSSWSKWNNLPLKLFKVSEDKGTVDYTLRNVGHMESLATPIQHRVSSC